VSLYEQLGGEPGIEAIVDDFYDRVIADDLLGAWFTAVDHARLRVHLRAFLAVSLGGPEGYTGRSMRQAHGGLSITQHAFETLLVRFTDALAAAGVEDSVTANVVALVATLRPVVVQAPR
jgi:hemoglobin